MYLASLITLTVASPLWFCIWRAGISTEPVLLAGAREPHLRYKRMQHRHDTGGERDSAALRERKETESVRLSHHFHHHGSTHSTRRQIRADLQRNSGFVCRSRALLLACACAALQVRIFRRGGFYDTCNAMTDRVLHQARREAHEVTFDPFGRYRPTLLEARLDDYLLDILMGTQNLPPVPTPSASRTTRDTLMYSIPSDVYHIQGQSNRVFAVLP